MTQRGLPCVCSIASVSYPSEGKQLKGGEMARLSKRRLGHGLKQSSILIDVLKLEPGKQPPQLVVLSGPIIFITTSSRSSDWNKVSSEKKSTVNKWFLNKDCQIAIKFAACLNVCRCLSAPIKRAAEN